MAENENVRQRTIDTARGGEPLLRRGRPADPHPETGDAGRVAGAATGAEVPANRPERGATASAGRLETDDIPASDESVKESSTGESPQNIEKTLAESRQRKLRLMLRQCDRVLLMDFDLLAMNGWPDNYTMAEARRSRDLWLFSALIAAAVFLSGLTGFVPAWIAGGGFGAFVIILLLGVPAVRRIYTTKPSYLDLIITRQRMLREARQHVAHLEGSDGLIWQCARMADFNPALKNTRFSHLLRLSESRSLSRQLTRREHVRLYLICLLEAEKAYSRVQKAFFEGNQEALDRGWEEVAAEPEPRT